MDYLRILIMNKIVLLNSPMDLIIDKRHFPPLGLASIAALLWSKGYVCDVIDGDLPEYRDIENIVSRLIEYDLTLVLENLWFYIIPPYGG